MIGVSDKGMNAMTNQMTVESETMLLIKWDAVIDINVNRQVHSVAMAVQAAFRESIVEVIPGYHTLAVIVDPALTNVLELQPTLSAFLETLEMNPDTNVSKEICIPVCYEGDFAPDMEALCTYTGMTSEEVIQRHTAPAYPVYLIGFLPGFPYLGGLDEKLHMPRKQRPRKAIAAGSVGIAGGQTGIYPLQSPGGWQLIGRTPIELFNVNASPPSCIEAGDTIRFTAISAHTYDAIVKGEQSWDLYAL
jgi:inhibitor of KinA